MSLRAQERKLNPPPKSINPNPDFILSAVPVGPRPTTAPTKTMEKRGEADFYNSERKAGCSRSRTLKHNRYNNSTSPNRRSLSPSQLSSLNPSSVLPITMNRKDKVALKLGRSLIHEISSSYDVCCNDDTMKHSRYFVDRWLASFDSEAKSVDAFGLEMLSRMTTQEARIRLDDTQRFGKEGRPSSPSGLDDRQEPRKEMVALACRVLDALVEESGREFPVLKVMRRAVYPSIFMEDANPEFGEDGAGPELRKVRGAEGGGTIKQENRTTSIATKDA